MTAPKVAVAPDGVREWLREAVVAGGGEVVGAHEATALIWTAPEDADGLRRLLGAHPNLAWVQLPWAGVEPYAEAGVLDDERVWTSGKGVYAKPVAEHALLLALAGLRDLKRCATAHRWLDEETQITLVGGRVTIFGGGGITAELIGMLAPFGCEITVVRRQAHPVHGAHRVLTFPERYEALKGADVVILALALTPETTGLISAVELELMEPHAWLVNVARGRHVVTDDLEDALRNGLIGGAALDVTDPEPLPEGHPLWALPNCLITPHVGNTQDMAKPLLSARVTENVRRFAARTPLVGVIDVEAGY